MDVPTLSPDRERRDLTGDRPGRESFLPRHDADRTNIFIDACRRNDVLVLTSTFVYDFAHPTQGRYHMQMFRDQAQCAADYIDYHVRGRLVKARHWRKERGM